MRTRSAVLASVATTLLVVGALAGVGAGVGATHSVNYVSLDPQVTANGTVVVEAAFIERSGWVVLHAPAEGDERLGEPLGTARVRTVSRFLADVRVPLDAGALRNGSHREVVAVLHGEDGDGEYTGEDPPLAGFGTIVRDEATVARGGDALVTAEGDFPQRVEGPEVTLRRVSLPADGRVVLRNRTADGRVVGSRALDAGAHRNVTVALNRSFYESRPGTFALRAELRVDGGPVRAGNATVVTAFRVRPASEGGAVVTTPVRTTSPGASPTTAAGDEPTGTGSGAGTGTTAGGTTSSGSGPGFGTGVAVAAVAIALVVAAWRRRPPS